MSLTERYIKGEITVSDTEEMLIDADYGTTMTVRQSLAEMIKHDCIANRDVNPLLDVADKLFSACTSPKELPYYATSYSLRSHSLRSNELAP